MASNESNQKPINDLNNSTSNRLSNNESTRHQLNYNSTKSNSNNNYGNQYKRNNQLSKPVRKKNSNYFNERPVFTCLVCCQDLPSFKLKAIFAIGPCNHMICYYCSTKMRVLCEQNECPTCRQELSEVIFTTNKDIKFSKLEAKRCIEYNSRYQIYFENELCLTEFYRLQEFRCQICFNDETLFSNLKELELHLRKEHDLFLCELCVNHVKIFPSERKYYTRKDLIRHKKTGDPDNKSYKGHSSCHLCNTMFFDEDDLLAHLKKDHYNCHFCDPSRTKMFFDNYHSLKQHFLDEHYICQEGFCRDEEITSAFANKFDLAAHKAHVHGGKITKAARVDFDIDFREGQNGFAQTIVTYTHSNANNNSNDLDSSNETSTNQSVPTQEDFPQLATTSSLAIGGSSNYAKMTKNETSLKKTNFSSKFQSPTSNTEDFPALATTSTSQSNLPSFAKKKFQSVGLKQPTIASLKKNKASTSSSNNQQKQPTNLKYADIASSFPPLANIGVNESWNKPLPTFNQDDFPDMPIKIKKTKKKTQYINVKKEAEEKKKKEEEAKKIELEKNLIETNSNDQNLANNNNLIGDIPNPLTNDGKMLSLKVPPGLHKLTQLEQSNNIRKLPPPGFQAHNNTAIDQSFDMNSLNKATDELIKSKNNNQFNELKSRSNDNENQSNTSRTGYIYPSNFDERNENLLKLIKQDLRTDYKFDQFKTLTDKFIRGHIDGDFYFRKCLELFDKNFLTSIFSELLVLLPHVKKQTEILAAYERYFNYNKGAMQNKQRSNQDGSKGVWILTNEKIEFLVCPKCQQVLSKDSKNASEHMNNH